MSRRNKLVIESLESKALKALRKNSGLTLRELAEKMGISRSRVSQMELGRDEISKEYIEKFLEALNLSLRDWEVLFYKEDNCLELRNECKEMIDNLSVDDLVLINKLLLKLKN